MANIEVIQVSELIVGMREEIISIINGGIRGEEVDVERLHRLIDEISFDIEVLQELE